MVVLINHIHELKCGQAEEKLEAGGDEKLLIFNFIWPYCTELSVKSLNFMFNLPKLVS